jgi:hypothetical protein
LGYAARDKPPRNDFAIEAGRLMRSIAKISRCRREFPPPAGVGETYLVKAVTGVLLKLPAFCVSAHARRSARENTTRREPIRIAERWGCTARSNVLKLTRQKSAASRFVRRGEAP